jgi:hypothetical protein
METTVRIHFSMFKLLLNGQSTDVAAALDVRLPTAPRSSRRKTQERKRSNSFSSATPARAEKAKQKVTEPARAQSPSREPRGPRQGVHFLKRSIPYPLNPLTAPPRAPSLVKI